MSRNLSGDATQLPDAESVLKLLDRPWVAIDLGCGGSKYRPDAIGVDARALPGVDLAGDATGVLSLFPDSSVDEIVANHFLEHVFEIEPILKEIARVIKDTGEVRFRVPHFSNTFALSDPTHRRVFGIYTFSYWFGSYFSREVPIYGARLNLRIDRVRIVFGSVRPRYGRHLVKKAIEPLVNLNRWTQEAYEEMFSFLAPAYELKVTLKKL